MNRVIEFPKLTKIDDRSDLERQPAQTKIFNIEDWTPRIAEFEAPNLNTWPFCVA